MRAISRPFILMNEPAALQANLQSIFGPNMMHEEVDQILNRVIDFLLSNGVIAKDA